MNLPYLAINSFPGRRMCSICKGVTQATITIRIDKEVLSNDDDIDLSVLYCWDHFYELLGELNRRDTRPIQDLR